MATITSASTTAQITAAYLDNCGYVEDASVAMAKAFITAATAMLQRGIKRIEHAGEVMEFSPEVMRDLIKDARQFVSVTGTVASGASGVKHADFSSFRD